ncbi:FUSC family membrane protein [Flavobacterium sp. 3HN19-14]|uniref:FUSC family protein n=1 Tax=Flavobacterium sp. 3HN19-14 TaxID=3448133 RepID=UPI003EDEC9B8
MIAKVRAFTDSTNFSNALKVTLAAVIPVLVSSAIDQFQLGFTIAIGAFLTYPSDIPSNLKHKVKGVLVAAFMVAGFNLVMNLIYPFSWLQYPVLGLIVFFLAMISVYGQRATMVSFSGLLSVCLAFAHIHSGIKMLEYSGLMLLGGLFYLLISLLFDILRPYRYVTLQIAECMRLTSKYMKYRGDLWNIDADKAKIIENQLHLQVEINVIHENLREILIRNRTNSGSSNQNRKMLLVFISLVEILELALSTSFDHNKLHQRFKEHPEVLETYQNLAYNLASTLRRISKSLAKGKKYVSGHSLNSDLEALITVIEAYETKLGKAEASEGVLMLTNMVHYAEKQIEKIKIIERAFTSGKEVKFKDRDRDLEKLVAPQYYPWQTFRENLSFSSAFFRHSLRLTLTILIGFTLGNLLLFQNSYWILLTIIVIMRPGYGLTKQRSYHRIIGTVAGGIIGFLLLTFISNHVVIGALAIFSMLMGFAFTQINYKVGATFVTMYVILIYGLLAPNNSQVVEYRIVDTLVGGILLLPRIIFCGRRGNLSVCRFTSENQSKPTAITSMKFHFFIMQKAM